MKKFLQLFVMFLLFAGTTALAANKFAVASGNWSATSTWSTDRGGAPGAAVPAATDTVIIPSPFMVTLDGSGKPCYNLIVEAGGSLIADGSTPVGSQRYIRVSGDFVQNDGIIGYNPAKIPDSTTVICFESYTAGKTVTFKGSGVSKINRIRNGSGVSNTTVVIDQDMTLTYTGSKNDGGVGWYGANGTSSGNKLVVNAGRTLTLVDMCYIATNSSIDSDGPTTTIQVDGSLLMNGPNCSMSLRPASGAVVSLIVNGTVEIGRTLKPTGTAGGGSNTSTITVNAGGVLKVGTAGVGVTYFHNPAQTVTGAGSFQFAGGTMQIGAAAGLDPVNGPIRTTTRSFATTAGYLYLSNAPQATGADLPANVGFLTVADTNTTLTLTNNLSVDTSLTLNYGTVSLGGKTLTVKGAAASANAKSFVDGSVIIPVSAVGAKTWTVGQDTLSLPLSAYFSSVTGSDNVTASVVKRSVTAPATSLAFMNKVLDRYYHVVKGAALTAFTADSLVLNYAAADVAAQGARKDSLLVFIASASGWKKIPVVRRDTASNLIVAGPVTALGDIVLAGADQTLPTFSIGSGNVPGETGHFATLKAACDSLNGISNWITSDVKLFITSDLTEAVNVALGPKTNGHTVTFKPYTGVTPRITFTQAADNAGLSGALAIGVKNVTTGSSSNYGLTAADSVENIVIDGSNTEGGKTRDLTFVTTSVNHYNTTPIVIIGNTNYITLKNLVISAGQAASAGASSGTYGIRITPRFSTINYIPDYITIDNCSITNTAVTAAQGVTVSNSGTPTQFPKGIVISNNIITATTRGIFLNYSGNTDIFGNEIKVIQPNSGFISEGIFCYTIGSPTSVTNIYKNKFTQLSTANVAAGNGIYGVWVGHQGIYNVYDNMFSGFVLPTAFKGIATGIGVSAATVNGITANIYHNSVYMPKNPATADTTAPTIAAFYLGLTGASGTRVADVRNNIFATAETTWTSYAFYWADSNKATLTASNNVLYAAGGKAKVGHRGVYSDAATLADWRTLSGVDTLSVAGNPQFVSPTDLHVNVNASPVSSASNAGTFIASVPTDIDGDLRSSLTPDIGADEFTAAPLVKAAVLTMTPASINFKNVVVNTPMKDSVTVKNTGTDSLFITNAVSSDPAFVITPTTARLDTGASKKFYVTYTPTTAGRKTALVVFSSNDSSATDTLRLVGAGLAPITIGEARKDLNGDFIADRSVTKDTVFIYGVVNSPNFGASYPQLANFVQDTTGGLEIYGYTLPDPPLVPGDSVYVIGTVAQYKGLVEVTPLGLDSAHFGVIKHNAKLTAKRLTLHEFMLNPEQYEGQLIELDTLYKASGTWPASAANGSVYVTNIAKTDTLQLYIDLDTDIDGSTEPAYPINVVGVISQYKSAAPFNGGYEIMPRYLTDIKVTPLTGVAENEGLPLTYQLANNYPNPFNPSTQIKFALPKASMTKLVVYDMLGREVKTLVNGLRNAGYYNVTWDGSNNHGIRVSSGMYIYRIEAGTFTESKKMMLLK